MKKSSKVLSLVLAVLMAVSCFSGLTIFSASAEETDTKIYFDVSSLPAESDRSAMSCKLLLLSHLQRCR